MTTPLVSALVAAYNIKDYIKECVDSICAQSYSKLEILIVDDGSTDGTQYICDELVKSDKRIRVFHKKNGGLVSARKYALEKAGGEYILFVDGDDSVKQDMIKMLVQRVKDTGADFVQCGFESSDGSLYIYSDQTEELTDEKRVMIIEKWLEEKPSFDSQAFTKLCKRSLATEAYSPVPDECSYGEDMLFFIELIRTAGTISSVQDALYKYRVRQGSLSHHIKYGIANLIDNDRLMNLLFQCIEKYYPGVSEEKLNKWYLDNKVAAINSTLVNLYKKDLFRYNTGLGMFLDSKKVIVYGAGVMGKDIIEDLSRYENITIVSWVDQNAEAIYNPYRKVYTLDTIKKVEFDKLIIAIANEEKAEGIARDISDKYSIPLEKIIWKYSRKKALK